jgi:hypothetical protein
MPTEQWPPLLQLWKGRTVEEFLVGSNSGPLMVKWPETFEYWCKGAVSKLLRNLILGHLQNTSSAPLLWCQILNRTKGQRDMTMLGYWIIGRANNKQDTNQKSVLCPMNRRKNSSCEVEECQMIEEDYLFVGYGQPQTAGSPTMPSHRSSAINSVLSNNVQSSFWYRTGYFQAL